ncbi:type II toxin-antitoxin system VapC family toxin [Xanthobacter versatilis]|uniref:type II toxin-antitoxin system VapC family toxin n=1 Tax=Xanthobacter autotrophicus (strain ATCC BAA-1158 / Py2) TaxID=78245 RepID=UPI003728BC14
MILVDTSIWIDHFRTGETRLAERLEAGEILTHPFVIYELALGNFRDRNTILGALADLPSAMVANDAEVLALIEAASLYGRGIGLVDAHLIASVRLTPDARLWTRDRRLGVIADELGLDISP